MNIEQETKSKLKEYYTKDEIYDIFKECLKMAKSDKLNLFNTFTVIKCLEKFYK